MKNIKYYITCIKEEEGKDVSYTSEKNNDGSFSLPYVIEPDWLGDFIEDFHNSSFIDGEYVENYETFQLRNKEVQLCTLEELKTMLTYIIRRNRFIEGTLMKSINKGDLYKIVSRLHNK